MYLKLTQHCKPNILQLKKKRASPSPPANCSVIYMWENAQEIRDISGKFYQLSKVQSPAAGSKLRTRPAPEAPWSPPPTPVYPLASLDF